MINKQEYTMWFTVLGGILLLYGIFKLIIGVSGLLLSQEQLRKMRRIPIIGPFISTDVSTAGKAIEVSIVCFALYAIFRGIYLLNVYDHQSFRQMMESRMLAYILYGGIGCFMVVFYTIIVYTKLDLDTLYITKDVRYIGTYKLIGLGTGLMFVLFFLGMYIWHTLDDILLDRLLLIRVTLACIFVIVYFVYVIWDSYELLKQKQGEILTMIMIPLGAA